MQLYTCTSVLSFTPHFSSLCLSKQSPGSESESLKIPGKDQRDNLSYHFLFGLLSSLLVHR